MSLHEFCRWRVVTISPRSTIVDACYLMARNNIGCMVVQEDGRLCGILTDRDIALKVAGEAKDVRQTKVGEVMTSNPVCISVDKNLHDLTSLMHAHRIRRVPIINGVDTVLGIVTMDDLIAMLSNEIFEIGKAVSETITVDEPFPLRFGRYEPARENTRG
jgi:CBS domain-containing protein